MDEKVVKNKLSTMRKVVIGVVGAIAAVAITAMVYEGCKEEIFPQRAPTLQCETLDDKLGGYKVLESFICRGDSCDYHKDALVAKVQKGDRVYNVQYTEGLLIIKDVSCTKKDKDNYICKSFDMSYESYNPSSQKSCKPYVSRISVLTLNGKCRLSCQYSTDASGSDTLRPSNNAEECPYTGKAKESAEQAYRRYACLLQPILDRLRAEAKEAGTQQTYGFMDRL